MNKKLYDEIMLGESWEEATRTPKLSELLREQEKQMRSGKPLFSLGVGTDGDFWITEEERENHFHVLGTTGEGKSKMLELLCRYDIDNDNPFLFLDSSAGGKTAYDVLRYCAFKKKKKVLFIDPESLYSEGKVIGLNPFVYEPTLEDMCVNSLVGAVRVVFDEKESKTPMISKYLPAILHVLIKAKATLYEALYFSERDDDYYKKKRYEIFSEVPYYDRFRKSLIHALHPYQGASATESTARRFEPMFGDIISLSLARTGIDFLKIVRDKWIIIVNLGSPHLLPEQRRFLGTLLLNGIDMAVDRLNSKKDKNMKPIWKGVYYMYIDEAQEYATSKISDILARKRKNGLRLILAHHHLGQLKDKDLMNDVSNLTKTKIAFHIPDPDERMRIVKTFFGGSLSDRDVHYVLGQQPARKCVVKKGKEAASIIKTNFVREAKADVTSYLSEIYELPIYFTIKEIRDEINTRFPVAQGKNTVPAGGGTSPNNRTAPKNNRTKTQHGTKSPDPTKREKPDPGGKALDVGELFLAAEKLKQVK